MDYYLNGQLDVGGRKTDALARQYASDHNVSYGEALRCVIKESRQSLQQKLDRSLAHYQQQHGSPEGWRVYSENGNILQIELDHAGQGVTRLGNIICGLPRLPDHSIDIPLALKIIRQEFSDIGREAAGGFLNHVAQKILGSSKPHEGMDPLSAMKEAQRQFPEVSLVYNGSPMSEVALRLINAPLFKTPQTEPPAPGGRSYEQSSVRRYSSDHVHYDQNGNQYRRY